MIATKVDQYPVETLFVTGDHANNVLFLKASDGQKIPVPDLCFGENGKVLPFGKVEFAVPFKDEWVNEQIIDMAQCLQENDMPHHKIYVIYRHARPLHVAFMAHEKSLSV